METSRNSNTLLIERGPGLCLRGSHASLSAMPASVREIVTLVSSGERFCDFSRKLDQFGSWERTSQDCLPLILAEPLAQSYEPWGKRGIAWDGRCMELPRLAPHTNERGCLSLPTPRASDGLRMSHMKLSALKKVQARHKATGVSFGLRLPEIVRLSSDGELTVRPGFYEAMMGFPEGWTNLEPSETP